MSRPIRLLSVLALLTLGGCELPAFMSYPPQVRGNAVDEDQLKQLVPGTSSRQDATALLGSPTAKATFDDNTWIYISEVTKPVIGGFQGVRAQKVVVLTFDARGVLKGVERKTQDDSMPVDVVARTTPSPGTEASLLQQLLGNVGKFSAAGAPSSTSGGTGPNGTVGSTSGNNF